MSTPASPTPRRSSARTQRLRAVLAGGLVLGIGAAVTLAVWTDTVHLKTDVSTGGGIDLEASIDGGAYAQYDTAGTAGVITFSTGLIAGNSTYYKPVKVRLAAGAANDATVTLTQAAPSASVAGLSYSIFPSATCSAAALPTGTALVSAQPVTLGGVATLPTPPAFDLARGATAAVAGTDQNLCFVLTASSTLAENVSAANLTWTLTGIAR